MSNQQITVTRPQETAIGGGIQGAESLSRETALWAPALGSPDRIINRGKPMADARGRDLNLNDGLTHGAVSTHKDSIVGAQYRLNSQPSAEVMARLTGNASFDDTWAEEFSQAAEDIFTLTAESDACWLDTAGKLKLTDQIRLAVAGFVTTGETIATADWLNKDPKRPCMTATQLVSSARLSNPNLGFDTQFLRRGVQKDARGRAQGYWFQVGYPRDSYPDQPDAYTWKFVPAQKPWGRKQVLHVFEPVEVGQSRGIADMVSALGHTNMAKKHNALTLQNAVIAASYAASLESELPPDAVYAMMGGNSGAENFGGALGVYMDILKRFFGDAGTMQIDGAKIPVLPPGTKFNSRTLGTPGGVGDHFQESLHRHTAAALGLSYAEYSKDWNGLSYTTARAAGSSMERFMRARKKVCADGVANFNYQLWLEEKVLDGTLPMPVGVRGRRVFYLPLVKEALSKATWIGSGSGQIDELKETQAALLRVGGGLSTREKEIARLGGDWRTEFKQLKREKDAAEKAGLVFDTTIARPNGSPVAPDPADLADPTTAQADPTTAPKKKAAK